MYVVRYWPTVQQTNVWVCSYCTVLISSDSSCHRSWAHPRRAAATCWGWCTRNQRGGHTRSRATPASAAYGLRWNRPTGSCERLKIPCSSLSAPFTATGIADDWLRQLHCAGGLNSFERTIPFFVLGIYLQPTSMRTSAWTTLNGQCTRTGMAGCTASLARISSLMASFISGHHLR